MEKNQGKRNRINGHNFEREVCKRWKEKGWEHAVTSRSESKRADDMGIDILHTLPFGVQCKYSKTRPNYIDILRDMPANLDNLVFHKQPRGKTYVTMTEEVFWKIIEYVKEHGAETRINPGLLQKPSSKSIKDKGKSGTSRKVTKRKSPDVTR